MDRQPTLEGERILLRPLQEDDWEALYTIASDPAIWEQHPIHDRWREEVFAEFFSNALSDGGGLLAKDLAKGIVIGSSQYKDYRPEDGGSVEIGWTFLSRSCWGKGFNHEMKRLMLAHAFQYVGQVNFRVDETNYRSRIALENIGAERLRRTELQRYQGKRLLYLFYAITAESFAKGPLSH